VARLNPEGAHDSSVLVVDGVIVVIVVVVVAVVVLVIVAVNGYLCTTKLLFFQEKQFSVSIGELST